MSYTHVDVAIVGAGIAGLAAARRARELDLSYVVLEANDRIGGRIYTATRADGRRWDVGAHWLRQPPINKLIAGADRLGVAYDRQWRPISRAWQQGQWLSDRAADDVLLTIDDAENLAGDLIEIGEDVAFVELFDPAYAHLPLAEAVLAFDHAASPRQFSALDLKQYGPFDGDWAVAAGFGALVDALFADADVELEAPVQVVDWGSDPIRVDFGHGLVEAERVVITASTGVLASNRIHFAPDLPHEMRTAIESLPLGAQCKVSVVVDPLSVDLEPGELLHTASDNLPVTLYRQLDSDLLIAVLSAPLASDLERDGGDAVVEAALDRIESVFGGAAMATVHDPDVTSWGNDPYTAGAASAAMPGAASSRQLLRAGVEGRIYFAGEATSVASFGTAHGAYASGIDAMDDIAESLGYEVERIWDVGVFRASSG